MYSVLRSYGLNGLTGFAVAVEADISGGLPAFSLVGLPDSAVRETVSVPPSRIWASSGRTGTSRSTWPLPMSARPGRSTTCPCCWRC